MRFLIASASLCVAACSVATSEEPITPSADELKINQIQVLGTHNSYSLGIDPQIAAFLDPFIADKMSEMIAQQSPEQLASFQEYHPHFDKLTFSEGLNYAYPEGLAAQLEAGLRNLEIDIFHDPEGGRFLKPAGYEILKSQGIDPENFAGHDTTGLDQPGFKVLHMADLDFRSSCNLFTQCLTEISDWSLANPDHAPLFIMLEAKDAGIPGFPGATEILPFDADTFDRMDAEILSVISRERIITPDDVRADYATLEEAVLAQNWPRLSESRGKFVFLLLTALQTENISSYFDGRPSLEGRVAFMRSEPGNAHSAFLLLDNALVRGEEIAERVRQGYLVRARSDIETYEAKANDYSLAEAALNSGAQIVSTDFYKPGNSYGTDYVVTLPGGEEMRCNPVNSKCTD